MLFFLAHFVRAEGLQPMGGFAVAQAIGRGIEPREADGGIGGGGVADQIGGMVDFRAF